MSSLRLAFASRQANAKRSRAFSRKQLAHVLAAIDDLDRSADRRLVLLARIDMERVADGAEEIGDADGAVDALDSARRFALSIPDSSDNADGFGCVAQAWTKVGEPSAAADWIRSHQDPIVEVTGLIDIARAMRSGGQ